MTEPLKPGPLRPPRPEPPSSWGKGLGYGSAGGFGAVLLWAIIRGVHMFNHMPAEPAYQPPVQLSPALVPAPATASLPPVTRTNLPPECHGNLAGQPIDLLRRCVDAGSSGAQNALGAVYYNGQDYAQAFSLFKAAADGGQTEARHNLAHMYRQGLGTPKNPAAARQLYAEGADRGDVTAQATLGDMLIAGEGGAADPAKGLVWIRQSAVHGYVPAMTALGNLYEHGTGAPPNLAKAAAWRKAAANAGDPEAMLAFGLMRRDGIGLAADPAEAYLWLSLAAQQDKLSAQAHAALVDPKLKRLPQQQRTVLNDEVASWKPIRPILPAPDLQ